MIARPGTWKEVWVGSYIRDKNGKVWKVKDLIFAGPTASLVDAKGKQGKTPWPADDTPVTVVEPTTQDAITLIQRTLDGQEVPQ